MDDKVLIAKRVACELKGGSLVNLGIGLPTLVPQYLPPGIDVYFQSENGIIGMAPVPGAGMEEPLAHRCRRRLRGRHSRSRQY